MARLYGGAGAARIAAAHVAVVGVGGVGSWAAECLARSGVGHLTLIDLDHVAESNINRQVHALDSTLGMAKVLALAARIRDINPDCQVHLVEDFLDPSNAARLLTGAADGVIDCVDQVSAKVAIAAHCRDHHRALVTCGAAGGKRDAARLQVADLALATHDPLLASTRQQLRKLHGFAAATPKKPRPMGVIAVFSSEPVLTPDQCDAQSAPQGLSCAGYGSAMHVTATMGLLAAGHCLNRIVATTGKNL